MPRTDLYLKVQLEHSAEEPLERLLADIDRQIRKVHGVRHVELSNAVTWQADPN